MSKKLCLINLVDFGSLRAQLEDKKVKSPKARKSRARRLQQLLRSLPGISGSPGVLGYTITRTNNQGKFGTGEFLSSSRIEKKPRFL